MFATHAEIRTNIWGNNETTVTAQKNRDFKIE